MFYKSKHLLLIFVQLFLSILNADGTAFQFNVNDLYNVIRVPRSVQCVNYNEHPLLLSFLTAFMATEFTDVEPCPRDEYLLEVVIDQVI